jgi:hypothetical protein
LEAEKDLAAKVVATEERISVKLASENNFMLAIYQDEDGELSVVNLVLLMQSYIADGMDMTRLP